MQDLLKQHRVDRTLTAPPLRNNSEASLIATCSVLLKLTPFESRGLVRLAKHELVSRQELHKALSLDGKNPTSKPRNINVVIWKLRRKLAAFGITIDTVQAFGYRLPPDSRDKIRELLAGFGADVVAATTPAGNSGLKKTKAA